MTHFIHAHTHAQATHTHTHTHTLHTHMVHTLARMYFCSHILGMQATVWLNVALRPPLPPLLLPLPPSFSSPHCSLVQLPVSPYAAILLLVFHLTEANFGITTHFFTFASLTSKQIIIVVIIESSSRESVCE